MEIRSLLADLSRLLAEGQAEEAVRRTRQALADCPGSGQRILLRDIEARALAALERYVEAEEAAREELSLLEELFGTEHPHLIPALHNLSRILGSEEKHAEALPISERELALIGKFLPREQDRHADALVGLAEHQYELSRFDAAEQLVEQALALYRESGNRLGISTCLNNLGRIYENRNENERGVGYLREASALREELLGRHPDTAFTLLNYGTGLAGTGKYPEASTVLERAARMYEELGLSESRYAQACRQNLELCKRQMQTGN